MFEEEAEEYLKKDGTKAEQILNALNEISPLKITLKQLPFILAVLEQAFKDGAELGYNKAKEEMQEQGLALQSDMNKTIEQNIQLKKQIEKMKCCQNCKKLEKEKDGLLFCTVGSFYTNAFGKNCDKWEVKEND